MVFLERSRRAIRHRVGHSLLGAALVLLPCFSFAAQDINVPGGGPIRVAARNVTWAGTGPNGFNNNYIFVPNRDYTGACISIVNADPNPHAFVVAALGSPDPAVTTYTTTTSLWNSEPDTSLPSGFTNPSVLASGVFSFHVRTAGYSRIVIPLSGGTGAGTASIFIVEDLSITPCVSSPANVQPGIDPNVPLIVQCDQSATLAVPFATTSALVASLGGPEKVYICAYSISVETAVTTVGTLNFLSGTGATCGTGTATVWSVTLPIAVGSTTALGAGLGTLFHTNVDQLCLENNTAIAGSVRVNISYAII